MEVVVNYWAIIVSAIAAIVLGGLWYGPLFGKTWMREMNISPEDMAKAKGDKAAGNAVAKSYGIMAITTFVMAFVLSYTVTFATTYTQTFGVVGGLMNGFFSWFGFVMPVSLGGVLWEHKSWKWWFITSGYYLVSLLMMSVILAVWTA